ncbi:hypothetical protein JMJ77_0015422, partial [Colletotrichum scovillei]
SAYCCDLTEQRFAKSFKRRRRPSSARASRPKTSSSFSFGGEPSPAGRIGRVRADDMAALRQDG